MSGPRVVIVAGEASGDRLGASLIRELRERRPDLSIEGIAGPLMRAEGCVAWHDSDELAVMGLFEVLSHLPRLLRVKRSLESRLLADPPDVFVGIDAPDFNLRVERKLRHAGVPTVHYVSPSVWAWREGRVKTLRRACDRVLCLLPFEAPFLEERGVSATFVGHPLADEIDGRLDRDTARRQLGLNVRSLVGILPGSRMGEVSRLAPVFARTASWVAQRVPGVHFAAPMASPTIERVFLECWSRDAPGLPVDTFEGRAHEVISASDAVLLASGTATLETMLLRRPMVVAYRVSQLTHDLLSMTAMADKRFFSLPNLLANRELVPELLQHEVTPEAVGRALLGFLESEARRDALEQEFAVLHEQLRCNAAARSAEAVLDVAGLA